MTTGTSIVDKAYARQYITDAISKTGIEAPDAEKANGTFSILSQIYDGNQQSVAKARAVWEAIQRSEPETAQLLGFGPRKWRRFSVDDLMGLPPPEFLYADEIIAGGLHEIYAPPGSGKSFVALDIACHVAQEHRVLYCTPEGLLDIPDRIAAWEHHHQKSAGRLEIINEPLPLMNRADTEQFLTELAFDGIRPKLIFIDTLSRSMAGGDENAQKDMSLVVENLEAIQKATGAAVVIIHHTTKTGRGYRGSSVMEGALDMMIELTNEDGLIRLKCAKSKMTAGFEGRQLELIEVPARDGRTSCVPIASDKVVHTPGEKVSGQKREVLEFLALDIFTKTGVKSGVVKREHPHISHVYRVLNQLKRLGYVRHADTGDPYFIEPAGRKAIGLDDTDIN